MKSPQTLLDNNQQWADNINHNQPTFFSTLAQQQTPQYLWIGCADSRVPASCVTQLPPGELFTHRNIANLVSDTDDSCQSVLEYAVNVLEVKHILVVGHYGCGGVKSISSELPVGAINRWLDPVRATASKHQALLAKYRHSSEQHLSRLCELNVIEQAHNVCQSKIVQQAWLKGQAVQVHGWIYDLQTGCLIELDFNASNNAEVATSYQLALTKIEQA